METVTVADLQMNALEKSRSKIIQALSVEPIGLQISQIMSICQLSNKTVRQILPTLNATEENGIWQLATGGHTVHSDKNVDARAVVHPPKTVVESKNKAPSAKPKAKAKTVKKSAVPIEQKEQSINPGESILEMLKKEPSGLESSVILSELGITNKQLHNAIWLLRKKHNIESVSLGNNGCIYALIAQEENTASSSSSYAELVHVVDQCKVDSLPVVITPEVTPVNMQAPLVEIENEPLKTMNDANSPEVTPVDNTAPNNAVEIKALLDECRRNIKTVVTRSSELRLQPEQLDQLLGDLFGMDQIDWTIINGKLSGIRLSKIELG